jgi:hypothetical protein
LFFIFILIRNITLHVIKFFFRQVVPDNVIVVETIVKYIALYSKLFIDKSFLHILVPNLMYPFHFPNYLMKNKCLKTSTIAIT